jgi:hypothetical protein
MTLVPFITVREFKYVLPLFGHTEFLSGRFLDKGRIALEPAQTCLHGIYVLLQGIMPRACVYHLPAGTIHTDNAARAGKGKIQKNDYDRQYDPTADFLFFSG